MDLDTDTDPATTTSSFRNRQLIKEHELNQVIRTLVVPVIDKDVRNALRKLQEPITFFGEDKADRRQRLAKLMAQLQMEGKHSLIDSIKDTTMNDVENVADEVAGADSSEEEEDEEFYTPGGTELLHARREIAKFSLERARFRLERQRAESALPTLRHVKFRHAINDRLKNFTQYGTQSGFTRPVSAVRFSPNCQYLATGDWSGIVRLFSCPDLNQVAQLNGHSGKTIGVEWHPRATLGEQSKSSLNLASGGIEGTIKLWSLESTSPIGCLKGHEGAVGGIDFHPSGRYIASASDDYTWRLWDLETEKEILMQEGHSKEVLAVRMQNDGALLASAGKDAIARVWDLRQGTTAMILDGHIREIYSLDFSPNGYQVATAGGDNSVIIWDLRETKPLFTIPAHTKLVSSVRFYKGMPSCLPGSQLEPSETSARSVTVPSSDDVLSSAGTFLVTSSYDKTIKIWSADNWALQKTLEDSERALCVDISNDQNFIISGRYDRYLSLWAPDNM